MRVNQKLRLSLMSHLMFQRRYWLVLACMFGVLSFQLKAEEIYSNALTQRARTNTQAHKNLIVEGRVIDTEGQAVFGATVRVKGQDGGTITDVDGRFQIQLPNAKGVFVVSFVGMQEQTYTAYGQTQVTITLKASAEALDELVVVGYGTQKKESVVAAISSISAKDIVSTPTSNIMSGLSGKMPGLSVMIKDGELGSESIQTLVRGQATMNNSSPLILVDGVERGISAIDPYDVESISVLKDASATAVFGVRGANGVILVTTKKGLEGKAKVSANLNYSVQNPTRYPEPMGAVDYMKTRNAVILQENEALGYTTPLPYTTDDFDNYANGLLPNYYVDRNFYKEFLKKNVPMMKGNVNIRGGSKRTKYFASVGYMKQQGPFKTERWDEYDYDNEERLDRFTYRANLDMQITKSLKGWVNFSGYLQDKNDPMVFLNNGASHYYLLMAAFADIPAISYPDLNDEGEVVSVPGSERTPYGMLNRTGYKRTTNNALNMTIGLQQKLDVITQGLSAKAIVSYDANARHLRGFGRTYQTYVGVLNDAGDDVDYLKSAGEDTELSSILQQSFVNNFDLEASLNYTRNFKKKHQLTGLMLYKQSQRVVNIEIPFNYVGIVGRSTYGYKNKYLAEFNFGMNGSEQFAKGKRFGFFPSASLGWVLSEEDFVKQIPAINFLKVRTSFGQVGNDKITGARFLYTDNWAQTTANGTANPRWLKGLKDTPGLPAPVYEEMIANPNITWEVANKYNVGVESRLLNVLKWDVDFFYEKRNSILTQASIVPRYFYGQSALPATNSGVMTNRGFESSLTYTKNVNDDLFLGANFSIGFARNRVESMNETPTDDTYAHPYQVEGFSRGVQWGYDCLGYFESEDEVAGWADQSVLGANVLPGDLKYRDANGDGLIDPKDLVPMEHPNVPEFNYSLSLFGQYKGFDFNVLLNAVHNYSYDISGRGVYDWDGNSYGGRWNYFSHHANAWTAERAANGDDYWYPRMYSDGSSVSKYASDFWIIDLWYMRIKNVELGYTLPKPVMNKLGMKSIRVFFTGSNLALFDNMPVKVVDPEVNNSLSHPIYATYNFGLNVAF